METVMTGATMEKEMSRQAEEISTLKKIFSCHMLGSERKVAVIEATLERLGEAVAALELQLDASVREMAVDAVSSRERVSRLAKQSDLPDSLVALSRGAKDRFEADLADQLVRTVTEQLQASVASDCADAFVCECQAVEQAMSTVGSPAAIALCEAGIVGVLGSACCDDRGSNRLRRSLQEHASRLLVWTAVMNGSAIEGTECASLARQVCTEARQSALQIELIIDATKYPPPRIAFGEQHVLFLHHPLSSSCARQCIQQFARFGIRAKSATGCSVEEVARLTSSAALVVACVDDRFRQNATCCWCVAYAGSQGRPMVALEFEPSCRLGEARAWLSEVVPPHGCVLEYTAAMDPSLNGSPAVTQAVCELASFALDACVDECLSKPREAARHYIRRSITTERAIAAPIPSVAVSASAEDEDAEGESDDAKKTQTAIHLCFALEKEMIGEMEDLEKSLDARLAEANTKLDARIADVTGSVDEKLADVTSSVKRVEQSVQKTLEDTLSKMALELEAVGLRIEAEVQPAIKGLEKKMEDDLHPLVTEVKGMETRIALAAMEAGEVKNTVGELASALNDMSENDPTEKLEGFETRLENLEAEVSDISVDVTLRNFADQAMLPE